MTEAETEERDEDDDTSELIEFQLSSVALMANGDLMALLENAGDLDENGQVPGEPDDQSPHKAGWKWYRQVSLAWKEAGRPRYVLSSSMASLMVSTKAPPVTDDTLSAPYDVFLLEVPGEWTSLVGIGPLRVLLVRMLLDDETRGTAIVATRRFERPARVEEADNPTRRLGIDMPDVCARVIFDKEVLDEAVGGMRRIRRFEAHARTPSYFTEAVRYLVNTCCLVTAHRECAQLRTGKNAPRNALIHDVVPPLNVVTTVEFRRHAQNLIANRRIAERKEALLHIVRGHWKRQVKGIGRSERSLIWVQPYQRGADSLGRIVEKTIKISGDR